MSSSAQAQPAAEPRLVAPDKLALGEITTIDVEILGFAADEEIELLSNGGSWSPVITRGARRTFRYALPEDKYPQVAVLVAVSRDHQRFAFHVIKLVGQPLVHIKSEPRTQIKVVVAGLSFGPIRTDGRGQATVRVQVPPGVQAGETIVIDRAGNASREVLSLASPDYRRTVIACPTSGERVLLFAVDSDGQLSDAAPVVSTSVGELIDVRPVRKGVFAARLVVDEKASGTHATLQAVASDARGPRQEQPASCLAPLPKERPVALALRLAPTAYVAGSHNPVQVEVELAYPQRREPRDETLTATVDIGSLSELVRQKTDGGAHVYVGTWQLPDRFSGKPSAQVTVLGETETLRAHESLRLLPGPLARLRASAPQTTVLADGTASIRLRVLATDDFDNPVAGLRVVPRARGRVGTGVESSPGTHVFSYTPRVSHNTSVDTVSFVVDAAKSLEATLTIDVQASRRPFLASATMGIETNFGRMVGPALVVDLAVRLPVWQRRVTVGLRSAIYTGTDVRLGSDGNDPVEVSVRASPLLLASAIEWGGDKLRARGGVLTGVLLAERSVASPELGDVSFTSPRFAWGAHAGASLRLGPGRLLADIMVLLAQANDAALHGNLGGMFFTGGYQIDL